MDKAAVQRTVQLSVAESMFRKEGKIFVPVASSARHIHLCHEHVEALFGKGYTLHKMKDLVQPGQFACEEQVTLVGPKGKLEKVRVLGPERKDTQVEIALTDSFKLGVKAPVRMSGKVENTPGCTLIGPAGSVELSQGVIIAARHLHISKEQSELFGLKDGQIVSLRSGGPRSAIFENVVVRAGDGHTYEVHLDTDEANAVAMSGSPMMEVLV